MLLNDRTGPDGASEPAPNTLAVQALGVDLILEQPADIEAAYVAVAVTQYANPRRRVYLSLHHATAAVQHAHAKGQQAWLVLCKLEPVAPDLDGEVTP
jgi:hypothetical protein